MIAAVWTVAKVGVETPGISVGRWLICFLGLLFRLLRCQGRICFFFLIRCSVARL